MFATPKNGMLFLIAGGLSRKNASGKNECRLKIQVCVAFDLQEKLTCRYVVLTPVDFEINPSSRAPLNIHMTYHEWLKETPAQLDLASMIQGMKVGRPCG